MKKKDWLQKETVETSSFYKEIYCTQRGVIVQIYRPKEREDEDLFGNNKKRYQSIR